MERTLIIASGEKAGPTLARFLAGCGLTAPPTFASSGAEARRRLHESEYDLIFLNAPLSDEFGGELAQRAAHETSASVFLLVKAEIADDISAKVEQDGILVLPKPLNRELLYAAVRLAHAVRVQLNAVMQENQKLRRKLEETRLVDRAKCILIECCGMTEPEAHAYLEKRAMDRRQTKREAAMEILQTQEE
ncbi:MAG: ANTAR domain-containing protein [Butyricicoccus sp.]|nr:ANTAR domain-containing protein [Butyricicoccus pullicaecorum]MCI6719432.1 ANTAR domain-containing protein [Clostridiales bacterium]MDY5972002.1 ANTAR domain-containing protein [Butyricicoccus sp.]